MQQIIARISGQYKILEIPDPSAPVWPGLLWGRYEQPLTPAFWASQAWMAEGENEASYQLGRSLVEEAVFCILGGYGAPAEVGLAASHRVCSAISAKRKPKLTRTQLEALLAEPVVVGERKIRYRFARQRARFLADAFDRLRDIDEDVLSDLDLRQSLGQILGIGPKTASWIVRNRRSSDQVAILDVHIVRACQALGIFPANAKPSRDYSKLEQQFLRFCKATRSRPSAMDAVMWRTMRSLSRSFLFSLIDSLTGTIHFQSELICGKIAEENACLDRAQAAEIRSAPALAE